MTQTPQALLDMFRKLGEDMKVPAVDMDKIVEHHRKNLEALAASGKAAAEGATAIAAKQKEIVEAAVKEIQAAAENFKLPGSAQEMMAAQSEFAKRAMEAAVRNTRDMAELMQKSNAEAVRVIQDRMKESFEEIRQSFSRK
ncbi:phasin family protein [Phreatobacter cathodiphilus]|uniref:Phasin family protein n=1 Tax=Phreatobacter cathodiphilus TaxID=1868589 RepID=A0A2S0NCP4_9HYPH|nr:TIGR01841 family phasin [Phreatobacter cathodiphilus]AVO45797.1 phasin family protein [Phreatobacter cathodiphilus]